MRDELVTLAGAIVGASTDEAPVVTAALVVGDSELPLERRAKFVLQTEDGRRIEIEPAKHPVIRPVRKASGPWRELEQHPVRPTGDFHPDGHLQLRGEWLVPGERVVVIGYVKAHGFVPETGGHREAPARQIALVRAVAIGAGEDAATQATKAMIDRERDIAERAKPKPPPSSTTYAWLTILAFIVAVLFVVIDRRTNAQTLGLALATSIFGLMFFWRASPTEAFPGGAIDEEEVTDPGTMVAFQFLLFLPLVGVLFFMAGTDEPGRRNGLTTAGWLMMGLFPLLKIAPGVLAKPRAEKGSQVLLPTDPVRRWILILGLIATWIASLALAVPHMSGDGPMT